MSSIRYLCLKRGLDIAQVDTSQDSRTYKLQKDESVIVNESPSDGESSENVGLQEACNKLCKIATKEAMDTNLGLKKIDTLELEKKNF